MNASLRPIPAKKPDNGTLLQDIRALIFSARQTVARNVNTLQTFTCFEIGRKIVEQEQRGKNRADYGEKLLIHLSHKLTSEFGKGFSLTNLKLMRQFFLLYSDRIGQTPSGQFTKRLAAPSALASARKSQTLSDQLSKLPFTLSWSHYIFLISIKDDSERSFYEIESRQQNWSLRELERQFNAGLYQRLALSRNKRELLQLAQKGQMISKPQDILKDPYILEFLGLDEKAGYSESELESAIIGKLEHFLLELGKGFLFEARQKRLTFGEDHFFVDLVFYNRLLKCYVLVDLKIGKLTHQDLGQMQMYVNYFDRYVKTPEEKPTIGIILCRKNKEALVEITLPKGANIHAREYRLYLPTKTELRHKLLSWGKDSGGNK